MIPPQKKGYENGPIVSKLKKNGFGEQKYTGIKLRLSQHKCAAVL